MLVKGSIVAIVTPMKANGDLDLNALDKLVDFHIESGTKGIIAVGTTCESATLEVSEHISVIERIVKKADKKVFIFAGTGANSTKEAIYLSMAAKVLVLMHLYLLRLTTTSQHKKVYSNITLR